MLRGVCYALRGHWLQAIEDLEKGKGIFYVQHELAFLYAIIGRKEKALKVLSKNNFHENDVMTELMKQRIEQILPTPICSAELVEAAKETLAHFLQALNPQIDPENIEFMGALHHVWPNTALGYPVPGQVYAHVLTPGFVIRFKYGNAIIAVHTDEKGSRYVLPTHVEIE